MGLRCCMWAFSSCGAWASRCRGFSCSGTWALAVWASVVAACGLRSCHTLVYLFHGIWDPPGPVIELVSTGLQGGFLTTGPGKPQHLILKGDFHMCLQLSEVAQSCPTLCNPMDCSLPGFSVHGLFQARILEWVAISFSRGSSWPRNRTRVSRIAGRRFILWTTREAPFAIN